MQQVGVKVLCIRGRKLSWFVLPCIFRKQGLLDSPKVWGRQSYFTRVVVVLSGQVESCRRLCSCMAPHCLGASIKAGCVSDFMANPFHNINFYFALSGFSVQVCAQLGLRGVAGVGRGAGGGGRGQEVPSPQAAEFKGRGNEYFK